MFGRGLDVKRYTCLSVTLIKKNVLSLSLSLSEHRTPNDSLSLSLSLARSLARGGEPQIQTLGADNPDLSNVHSFNLGVGQTIALHASSAAVY